MDVNKEQYTIQDFVADPDFKDWVLHGRHNVIWNKFLQDYPHKAYDIKKAQQILLTLATPTQQSHKEVKEKTWQNITSQIDRLSGHEVLPDKKTFLRYSPWLVAASFLFALGIIFFPYLNREPIVYETGAGEEKLILLPDSSKVLLIGHSQLRHSRSWNNDESPREVWIQGNAYFDVKHTQKSPTISRPSDQFIVHTTSNGKIEVLGTTFSVSSILNQVLVHLENGSIRFSFDDQVISLSPGDAISLSNHKLAIRQAAQIKVMWNKKELVLEKASLSEVLAINKHIFGTEIKLPSAVNPNQLLDGTIPFDRQEDVLEALSVLLDHKLELDNPSEED